MLRNKIRKAIRNPDRLLDVIRNKTIDKPYISSSVYLNSRQNIGTNVFRREWDVLIILDTCRVDALRELAPEYDFIDDVESYWSVGGQSAEWMANTFANNYRNEVENTTYISSNPYSETVFVNRMKNFADKKDKHLNRLNKYGSFDIVNKDTFESFIQLWRFSGDEYEHCPPIYVTDCGISEYKKGTSSRMILHYMPPHTPYIEETIPDDNPLKNHYGTEFDYLMQTGNKKEFKKVYLNMLRWVLDNVRIVLDNIDAKKVAITADHGEGFGEYGTYLHPAGSLHPHVRQVPWVITTAEDIGSYEPNFSPDKNKNNRNLENSLEALGYM